MAAPEGIVIIVAQRRLPICANARRAWALAGYTVKYL